MHPLSSAIQIEHCSTYLQHYSKLNNFKTLSEGIFSNLINLLSPHDSSLVSLGGRWRAWCHGAYTASPWAVRLLLNRPALQMVSLNARHQKHHSNCWHRLCRRGRSWWEKMTTWDSRRATSKPLRRRRSPCFPPSPHPLASLRIPELDVPWILFILFVTGLVANCLSKVICFSNSNHG